MARTISHSVGRGGVNRSNDVKTVQELINDNMGRLIPLRMLANDGRYGTLTQNAIDEFQRRIVGLRHPDGRVDPGGRTLAELNKAAKPSAPSLPVPAAYRVMFQHGGTTPPSTNEQGADKLYESSVSIVGAAARTFRGSIYPDDMNVKGRIKDGTYDLYLGFHKRAGNTAMAADLEPRADGFRAVLVVNKDLPVPVISHNAAKTTSTTVHVHNGYNSKRFSDGCQTLHPSDWRDFIKVFLDAFPRLGDWTATNPYCGKKIGVLEVRA